MRLAHGAALAHLLARRQGLCFSDDAGAIIRECALSPIRSTGSSPRRVLRVSAECGPAQVGLTAAVFPRDQGARYNGRADAARSPRVESLSTAAESQRPSVLWVQGQARNSCWCEDIGGGSDAIWVASERTRWRQTLPPREWWGTGEVREPFVSAWRHNAQPGHAGSPASVDSGC